MIWIESLELSIYAINCFPAESTLLSQKAPRLPLNSAMPFALNHPLGVQLKPNGSLAFLPSQFWERRARAACALDPSDDANSLMSSTVGISYPLGQICMVPAKLGTGMVLALSKKSPSPEQLFVPL